MGVGKTASYGSSKGKENLQTPKGVLLLPALSSSPAGFSRVELPIITAAVLSVGPDSLLSTPNPICWQGEPQEDQEGSVPWPFILNQIWGNTFVLKTSYWETTVTEGLGTSDWSGTTGHSMSTYCQLLIVPSPGL